MQCSVLQRRLGRDKRSSPNIRVPAEGEAWHDFRWDEPTGRRTCSEGIVLPGFTWAVTGVERHCTWQVTVDTLSLLLPYSATWTELGTAKPTLLTQSSRIKYCLT